MPIWAHDGFDIRSCPEIVARRKVLECLPFTGRDTCSRSLIDMHHSPLVARSRLLILDSPWKRHKEPPLDCKVEAPSRSLDALSPDKLLRRMVSKFRSVRSPKETRNSEDAALGEGLPLSPRCRVRKRAPCFSRGAMGHGFRYQTFKSRHRSSVSRILALHSLLF